jgi:hypothetical protein
MHGGLLMAAACEMILYHLSTMGTHWLGGVFTLSLDKNQTFTGFSTWELGAKFSLTGAILFS